jgi:hypothetical protein
MGDFKDFLEGNWASFRPRQRELPFMHQPGYNRKADTYLDKDLVAPEFEEDNRFNLYHVTTNLAGVKVAGRLKSRRELGVVGLGGGATNEDSFLVSTTYDYNRSREIYDEIKLVAEIVHGRVKASTVWNGSKMSDAWENPHARRTLRTRLPKKIYKQLSNGEIDDSVMDQYIKSPEDIYDFFQDLETASTEYEQEDQELYNWSVIGFTGSFSDMVKINPNQVAIIQVIARKGAKAKHINLEKELRFRPEDLKVVRYLQP